MVKASYLCLPWKSCCTSTGGTVYFTLLPTSSCLLTKVRAISKKIPVIPSFSLTFPFSFCSGPHQSGFYLPYPPTALGWEVSFIFLYAIVEMIRLFQASKGNKTEQIRPLFWSLLLSISVIIANAYYIDMQTYVMRVDVILNVVSLSFVGLEFVLSLIAMIYFSRNVG
jgi:transmembrane protein 216